MAGVEMEERSCQACARARGVEAQGGKGGRRGSRNGTTQASGETRSLAIQPSVIVRCAASLRRDEARRGGKRRDGRADKRGEEGAVVQVQDTYNQHAVPS